jgi:hypothetical protein
VEYFWLKRCVNEKFTQPAGQSEYLGLDVLEVKAITMHLSARNGGVLHG